MKIRWSRFGKRIFSISLLLFIAMVIIYVGREAILDKIPLEQLPGGAKISALLRTGTKQETMVEEEEAQQEEKPAPVKVFRVARTYFEDNLPVMGTIEGISTIPLKFEISGVLTQLYVREGDLVSKGDLVGELDDKDARLKVKYAASKVASAEVSHQGALQKLAIHRQLYEMGAIVEAKVKEVEIEAQVAEKQLAATQVELESAESDLTKTKLHAPSAGVITSKKIEPGEFVTPQNDTVELTEIFEVYAVLGVIEKDIEKIAFDQEVEVEVDAYPGKKFTGLVDNITPALEGKTRTLTVKVKIENPDNQLLPGMFARCMVRIFEMEDALVMPSMALEKTEEGYSVFVVEDEKVAKQRQIQIGYVTTDYAQIESGLEEGELVVVETHETLKDGREVEITEIKESDI
ncbi:MAG: efflux RND transporter periplasmic adaptor subunit [Candidatus Omnitrophica bacterium]|nr:efflux RND transporter periplasmic adaptor subunit [Candidatus Omnitrophota bacterium]